MIRFGDVDGWRGVVVLDKHLLAVQLYTDALYEQHEH